MVWGWWPGAVNPFSPNNSSAEPKTGGKSLTNTQLNRHSHTIKFRRCVRARDGKRHTDDRLQLPQITQIIYWILLFYFFTALLNSFGMLCTFSLFFATAHFSYLLCFFFFAFLLVNFFLLYFSSFSRARVVFRLILFFFLLLRPFSHAPPRLLIARNRCDFAHLYVFFFLFYLPLMCLLVPFLREQLDYCATSDCYTTNRYTHTLTYARTYAG